jgi:hypothetical protein
VTAEDDPRLTSRDGWGNEEALMLDNPEKTARLLAALEAALPFEVELTTPLLKHLKSEGSPEQVRFDAP